MGVDKKNFWYLCPTMVIDRAKYRGKGRPRKSDYRKYPGPQDFMSLIWEVDKTNENSHTV